ncbi:phosphosulfolactate synthase [Thermincola ferriacetica]
MDGPEKKKAWSEVVDFPIPGRTNKPRIKGLTMVIDKGLGLVSTEELLSVAGDYIDYLKLGFGTSALYDEDVLVKKISLVRSCGADIYPGGTFFEVAWLQNKVKDYLKYAWHLGFSAIEISDGTVDMGYEVKRNFIAMAKDMGFKVITEVGKKDLHDMPDLNKFISQVKKELDSEADLVIIEGRESGKGIGMYDARGNIRKDDFAELLLNTYKMEKIMWEAPLKKQQQEFITLFGPNVNLGNVAINEILALEALRVGMRGDTLKNTLSAGEFLQCVLI